MTKETRGGDRPNERSLKNNPKARNQSDVGERQAEKGHPAVAAVGAAAAVGAGIFLWSRRDQISEQISNFVQQVGEGRETGGSSAAGTLAEGTGARDGAMVSSGPSEREGRSQVEIAQEALTLKETGSAS